MSLIVGSPCREKCENNPEKLSFDLYISFRLVKISQEFSSFHFDDYTLEGSRIILL
jgi:hypothetical protein